MRAYNNNWLKHGVAVEMRRQANRCGTYSGLATSVNQRLIRSCSADHLPTGTHLIFTRDAGMHTNGWWKNPDYERCWHLSLSFLDPITRERAPKDSKLTDEWLEAFFGDDQRYLWAEPPYSVEGKKADVWHYRLFCDAAWSPILPRGEVYSKEFTEKGWLSFSDLRNAHHKALAELAPLPGEQ
jgi:hypothetical protein